MKNAINPYAVAAKIVADSLKKVANPVKIQSNRLDKSLLKITKWYTPYSGTTASLKKHLMKTGVVADVYLVQSLNGTLNTIIQLK